MMNLKRKWCFARDQDENDQPPNKKKLSRRERHRLNHFQYTERSPSVDEILYSLRSAKTTTMSIEEQEHRFSSLFYSVLYYIICCSMRRQLLWQRLVTDLKGWHAADALPEEGELERSTLVMERHERNGRLLEKLYRQGLPWYTAAPWMTIRERLFFVHGLPLHFLFRLHMWNLGDYVRGS